MEIGEIEKQLKSLLKEVEQLKKEQTTNNEAVDVWLKYNDYITKHDNSTLDWDNHFQNKYFLYAVVETGQLRIGKTTEYITPFIVYASNPKIIKDAVDFIGEDKIKNSVVDMPYRNSEPMVYYDKPKDKSIGKYGVYNTQKELIRSFETQKEVAKFCECSQGMISQALKVNKVTFRWKIHDKYFIRHT